MSVLVTLGLLQTEITELIRPRLDDTSPQVAIAAGWALLTKGDKEGENALKNWVLNGEPEWQRMASAAVSKTGKNGVNLCLLLLKKTKDPFVRVNLAMGLIGQRKEVPLASKVLFEALKTKSSEFWMWDSSPHPLFRTLAPSRVKHIEQIPNYPQVVDQMTSLDLLSVLSITKHPKAQESVKNFLRNQAGEVVGAAASSLLEEGDEEAFECVRELLFDSEPEIRFQAAYILAVHAGDREALKVLVEAYPTVDREKKVHILEAVAHIGDPETIAFLIDVLHEPFQVLRVVAASALIQCLYH